MGQWIFSLLFVLNIGQLYIIEGSITVAFGLIIPLLLADYPSRCAHLLSCWLSHYQRESSTKWLSERERYIAQARLVVDVGVSDDPDEAEKSGSGILHGVILAVKDVKVWALS